MVEEFWEDAGSRKGRISFPFSFFSIFNYFSSLSFLLYVFSSNDPFFTRFLFSLDFFGFFFQISKKN